MLSLLLLLLLLPACLPLQLLLLFCLCFCIFLKPQSNYIIYLIINVIVVVVHRLRYHHPSINTSISFMFYVRLARMFASKRVLDFFVITHLIIIGILLKLWLRINTYHTVYQKRIHQNCFIIFSFNIIFSFGTNVFGANSATNNRQANKNVTAANNLLQRFRNYDKQAKMQYSALSPIYLCSFSFFFNIISHWFGLVWFGLYIKSKPLKLIFRFVVGIGYFTIEITAIDHCVCV